MARFRAFKLQGVRAIFDNGIRVSISENFLEITKRDPFFNEQELKSWSKQYEISEEEFNAESKRLLSGFPEVKEVVNG